MKIHWETNVGNGVRIHTLDYLTLLLTALSYPFIEFDRKDIEQNKLTVCTLDSRIFVFDLTTKHPSKGYAFARQKV